VPAVGIADDNVDRELVEAAPRWDVPFIGRFMVHFGLVSSVFDFLTFGVLLFAFRTGVTMFRTAWFLESLLTELVVALVVRTRRPSFMSRPGRLLAWTTALMIVVALAVPYVPFAARLGFVPPPPAMLGVIAVITVSYAASVEGAKWWLSPRGNPTKRRRPRRRKNVATWSCMNSSRIISHVTGRVRANSSVL